MEAVCAVTDGDGDKLSSPCSSLLTQHAATLQWHHVSVSENCACCHVMTTIDKHSVNHGPSIMMNTRWSISWQFTTMFISHLRPAAVELINPLHGAFMNTLIRQFASTPQCVQGFLVLDNVRLLVCRHPRAPAATELVALRPPLYQ